MSNSNNRSDGLPATVKWNGEEYETPEFEEIESWIYDSVCEAVDGCTVEPDGTCYHGAPSWLLAVGLV